MIDFLITLLLTLIAPFTEEEKLIQEEGIRREIEEMEGESEMKNNITILNSSDGYWVALYLEGKLIDEGHSLREDMLLTLINKMEPKKI